VSAASTAASAPASNLPGHQTGIQAIAGLQGQQAVRAAPALAAAFGTTFWAAVALIVLSVVPALLLPRPVRERGGRPGGAAV